MNLVSGIICLLGGTLMLLIGFKIINVFNGIDSEKVDLWYKKWGLILKFGGVFVLLIGLINLIF